ncbi:bidirectional sugar transporter SWEET13-like [Nicotiana tabacum]|uniref:Bidirectional sugar transporter SWEET n=1 Tax=Nicotiana tabacum TaxID=4097 RepID=A0A1S4BBC8_TOBAC|nr:PREDICTED: bidirectional sugar transporter SWEET13-like [Nicotiana tabacum]
MANHPLIFAFGILGNIFSFMVFISPVPTFYGIVKKKSAEGFQSVPYVVALFSSMLWIYYAMVKTNETLIITINSFGCIAETIYVAIYFAYATKKARMQTLRLVLLLNFGGFGLILFLTQILCKGPKRAEVVGWICMAFSISVFVAPLSIMGRVIRTKSVEFMPFNLSLTLTLSAVMWFLYGLLLRDIYVTVPNIAGIILGMLQMVLYGIYRNAKPNEAEEKKLPTVVKLEEQQPTTVNSEVNPVSFPSTDSTENEDAKDGKNLEVAQINSPV